MHTPFFFPCLGHLSPSIPILSSRTHMDWEHTLATLYMYTCMHEGKRKTGKGRHRAWHTLPAFLLQEAENAVELDLI
jgi:hypothetical protein